EAPTTTARARRVRIGHELHVELDRAIALAAFAAAAADVEREAARLVSTDLRKRHLSVQVTEQVEELRVGCGIRARTPTNWRLVDLDEFLEEIEMLDVPVCAGNHPRAVQLPRSDRGEDIVDQRAFSRTRHAGDARQQADREARIDALQIVLPRLAHGQERTVAHLRGCVLRNAHAPR